MKSTTFSVGFAVVLMACCVFPAAAPGLALQFHDGRVTLRTQDVPLSAILAEWARVGRTTIVNEKCLPDVPLTLEMTDVPEGDALAVLLRSTNGYMATTRTDASPGLSTFDRILLIAKGSAEPLAPGMEPSTAVDADTSGESVAPAVPRPMRQPNPSRRDD